MSKRTNHWITWAVLLTLLLFLLAFTSAWNVKDSSQLTGAEEALALLEAESDILDIPAETQVFYALPSSKETETSPPVDEWVCPLTDDEVELLALLTMAEAEGEPEYGQRLVIDSVLNRMDSERFPDSVHDVVYQKNQYSSMTGGRAARCFVKEELRELVRSELKERTDYDVVFFRTGHYHPYGTPLFRVGAHYFSKCG